MVFSKIVYQRTFLLINSTSILRLSISKSIPEMFSHSIVKNLPRRPLGTFSLSSEITFPIMVVLFSTSVVTSSSIEKVNFNTPVARKASHISRRYLMTVSPKSMEPVLKLAAIAVPPSVEDAPRIRIPVAVAPRITPLKSAMELKSYPL